MKSTGIYIHVPFCAKKCPYCDFYSERYSGSSAQAYVDAVIRNLSHYSDRERTADTIYFGGGTPSLLRGEQLRSIIGAVGRSFRLADDTEITLEANPCTLTPDKLREFFSVGINRLSIGVQSMNDSELRLLGRTHTAERAERAVLDAFDTGFTNISCDLMTALPDQTAESIGYSIERLAALPITHISSYILKVEDGTPFDREGLADALPDDELSSELYLKTVEMLAEKGFEQYEISNFAKSGFKSRHNLKYWQCREYLGIGPSAHSCFGGRRFAVGRDLDGFISSEHQRVDITDDSPCSFEEYAMLRLRLTEGLDLRKIGEHRSDIEKKIPDLLKVGYINYDGNVLSLTPRGAIVSNSVIGYLIF